MLGTQTRRSFRDRRIPMRPDVSPGGASPVGEQRVLRSRRLGPGPTCRSGDGSPENSPWAICTICTARRGRWADGSGKWRERGYQPAFSARPYVIAVLACQGRLRPCMARIWPICVASACTTAPAASIPPDPLPPRHAFGAWRRSCAPPPTWSAWPVRPAVEGVHTAGMIRPRRGHGLLRPRLRMSSSRSANCGAVRRCSLQTPQGRQPQVDDRPAHVAHFTAAVYRGCSRRRFVGVDSFELRCVEDGDEVLCLG